MANIVCYELDGSILSHYTQWDVNQKLVVKGADTSSVPDFHFTNALRQNAIVFESQVSDGSLIVNVPDEMLQHDVPIIVHICYESGTTEYTIRIPVMPRRKPADYLYTDSGSGNVIGAGVRIVNDLLTDNPKAALSAAQGVVIKSNLDAIGESIIDCVKADEMNSAISSAVEDLVTTDEMNKSIEDALVDFDFSVEDGATFIPSIDADGNLSWSNDKNLQNPETINIIGPEGKPGNPGDPGEKGDPGRGIVSIIRTSGTGAAGTTDTYTITYTDDTTSTFSVYNGANGRDGVGGSDDAGTGASGANGATFIPYVDSSGNLSWSNDKGLANPETVNIKGPKGDSGEKGDTGSNGQDGVSATHLWNGTVLSITSASGTTSSDLKGDKGDAGESGYSPIRGVDYWTNEDIVEIKTYVDNAILGGEW